MRLLISLSILFLSACSQSMQAGFTWQTGEAVRTQSNIKLESGENDREKTSS